MSRSIISRLKKMVLSVVLITVFAGCGKLLFDNTFSQSDVNDGKVTGYVEGDYRYVNAPQSGWIGQNQLFEGQKVGTNTLLFSLDNQDEKLATHKAQTQLAQAKANLQNLQTGERDTDLQVIRNQRKEIKAQLELAKKTLARYQQLRQSGAISALEVDNAKAQVVSSNAQMQTLNSQLAAKQQPARKSEIAAASAAVASAKVAIEQAKSQLAKRQISFAQAGTITKIYRYSGEFVTTGTPILQILPDHARKVIFFLPASYLANIHIGNIVQVTFNSVDDDFTNTASKKESTATISYISDSAEYTPPMLYSENNRNDLVFRVEAQLASSKPIPVGLPVTVTLKTSGESVPNKAVK